MKHIFFLALFVVAGLTQLSCDNSKKQVLVDAELLVDEEKDGSSDQRVVVYEGIKDVAETPVLEKAIEYFRAHNKYKDWDANDKRKVLVQCTILKDGVVQDLKINSCGIKKLDDEAIRLIKTAKILPGKDAKGEPMNCSYTILVHFPAE